MKKYKRVYIEITNVCNLNCSFCPSTKRTLTFIRIDNFSAIIEKLKPYTSYLYFHVKGEPLLHPDLGSLLRICHDNGFRVNLTTNGTLIKEKADLLLNSAALRQISFSLQSIENYSNMADKENYLRKIFDFIRKAIAQTELIIELRLWSLTNETAITSRDNLYVLNAIKNFLELPYGIEETITSGKGLKLTERIYLSQSYEFEWPNLSKEIISNNGFCYALRNQIAVLVDGTIVPCCLDSEGDINLGNIYESELTNIIQGERALNIVKGFSNRMVIEPLCMRCGYRNRFDIK